MTSTAAASRRAAPTRTTPRPVRRASAPASRGCCSPTTCRTCPRTWAIAVRPPARRRASPTASSTTGRAPGWSSPASARPTGRAASASTASATSWCSRSSSDCSTPGSRCRTSAVAVNHLRERGVDDLAQITLMSDGATVYECTSADEVVDLVQGGQGVFGIAVGRVWREVEGSLAAACPASAPTGAAGRRGGPRRRAVRPARRPQDRLTLGFVGLRHTGCTACRVRESPHTGAR